MKLKTLLLLLMIARTAFCQQIKDGNSWAFMSEKVYLHFDKPYYAIGDTIYFKAYVTIGPHHKLSLLSGILNVDLIKPDEKIYRSIKLQLTDGVAWGDYALDDTLKTGNYRIRAYTNWMRNAGEDYFFNRNLPVVDENLSNKKTGKLNNTASDKTNKAVFLDGIHRKYDVQFFPEGGSLISGIPTKIGFKAISSNGLGTSIEGIITDNEGHQILSFNSQHLGMGEFKLNPESGKTYKASITFADGSTIIFDLPKASDTGYALTINSLDSTRLKINITAGQLNPATPIFLVAQSGGNIYYTAKSSANAKDINTVIPNSRFPTGIVQFTLFSSAGEPLNERLVFINNNDRLNLGVSMPLQSYAPHEKVKIRLDAKDKNGQPVTGLFSVSVTDETKVPPNENTESNILSGLLLTSDIKGYIEQPNYYFTNISDNTRADLDLLMLTQGYHRFEWKQLLNGNLPPVVFPPEKTLYLSGMIKSRSGKPIPKGKVSMLSTTDGFLLLDTTADVNGKFVFAHLPVRDGMRYIIQAENKKFKRNSIIIIDSTTAPIGKYRMLPLVYNDLNSTLSTYKQSSVRFHAEQDKKGLGRHAIPLKEVMITGKKRLKYVEHSANLRGPGNADQVVTADELPLGCPVFTDCMKGILRGIDFGKVLVVIDGMTLPNDDSFKEKKIEILNTIDMNSIGSIEVLRYASTAGVYGVRGGSGVLIITTKQRDDIKEPDNLAPGIISYSPKGFYKAREFYSPQYDNPHTNQKMADLRSTIYWNPNIITDKDGKASFSYFNADGKGTYRVVIEGIDADGNLGRQVLRYKVN